MSEKKANKFMFFLAKLFGTEVTASGMGVTITSYYWRGTHYIVRVDEDE